MATMDLTSSSSDITTVHPDIIITHILTLLDGPSLASAASATSHLRRLCTQHHLWRNICVATWPSLNDPLAASFIATFPAAIFSDSFPSIHHSPPRNPIPNLTSPQLISAVDLYYKAQPLFSRVITTQTHTGWFLSSPLSLDLLHSNELVPTPLKFDHPNNTHHLALSWIIIDPTLKRAANLSSRHPVSARRHWLTGDLHVLYALPMETVQCVIKVTCSGKVGGSMHVREVSLTMEDTEGKHLMGRDSLVILQDAILNGRRTIIDAEEAKQRFHKFSILKRETKQSQMRRDNAIDMLAMSLAFTLFLFLFCSIFMAFPLSPISLRSIFFA